ncbi:MAG: hypothetical protein M1819_005636 [Sarea resinae]|nr:MAG: hypothetical protein M1819_005636 [Sarea resinae]
MFQSFTGNSRRPRQVNLSGRNTNPFAAAQTSRQSPGPQTTLANAQQERLSRQRERDRLNSAKTIQRTWRGHRSRTESKNAWRRDWDLRENIQEEPLVLSPPQEGGGATYLSDEECEIQLRTLLQFANVRHDSDTYRLDHFISRFLNTVKGRPPIEWGTRWPLLLLKLEELCFEALGSSAKRAASMLHTENILSTLTFLSQAIPKETARHASAYYRALSETLTRTPSEFAGDISHEVLFPAICTPLQIISSETLSAYEGFASKFLTTPNLAEKLLSLRPIAEGINYKLLANALANKLKRSSPEEIRDFADNEGRLWLLAYFIYFHEHVHGPAQSAAHFPEPDYVATVSILLSSLAHEIANRISVDDVVMADDVENGSDKLPPAPLQPFIKKEIYSLVNQQSISSLLSGASSSQVSGDGNLGVIYNNTDDAKLLASYALTLLRVFPRRADDIRMWLYLGSTTSSENGSERGPGPRVPAIKYFWRAVRRTSSYASISKDPRSAVSLLKPRNDPAAHYQGRSTGTAIADEQDQEWRIILLFFELYTFVLKVMDDEEFFSGSNTVGMGRPDVGFSWTRESALPLSEVKDMTVFLKNLAFTMYWNASEITESADSDSTGGIGTYFSTSAVVRPSLGDRNNDSRSGDVALAGVKGISIDYLKGIVTGLLRMIYERDSRRNFLPKDHWLMTSRFDMGGFIPAVVVEEENRHQVQEADDDEEDRDDDLYDEGLAPTDTIIGTRRVQQTRNVELLRKQQRKASRKKYLEAITPRLEILQNMPFFIPFATRVQIFREFVHLDQVRRRGGHVDPDNWRMSIMQSSVFQRTSEGELSGHDIISKHHAKIKRESVFEDAYEQFYELGEGLKEPIQITFVDRFDTVEAGIDGGGVTKEFLTSVTNEAFSPSAGLDLFVENDHHLLYPNPAAVDERKELLLDAGFKEGSPDWNEQIRELLRRYEFLGRIIGKCLYEGILVDIAFAPFFLLKWALTGGSGSASKESGYRANLNDLRDLDEGLYQGLLQLKNYPGDVEDFSLNFTVTDPISITPSTGTAATTKTITRDLKPNGANTPVTNSNRLVYISYIARHRLSTRPQLQTSAFLRGLSSIIQPAWLSMFNQSELQTLVGGTASPLDVADLRRHTLYGGVYALGHDGVEHPSVRLFWDVMRDLSDADRRKVLKFVTSTPRAPLLGFGSLNPRFSIRDAGDDEDRLPSTSTCVNLLKLPRYGSKEVLRSKLLYAVNSGAGFDLS